ncbi:hypothetical protein [Persicobacter sp. CCB-QB2]|nr:hypothetical protein [Persicobacter sp. CCB-QB2]
MEKENSDIFVGPGGILLKREENLYRALKWVVKKQVSRTSTSLKIG